ncbi:hypothetical protein Phi46:1_gp35 [Cellulophaga phage phi46:1]|nr:hypothetical protein Phi46:1_gp35 [Cellulophaga phage phi46:1]AGO47846.1 hypothetical protein Phi46:1_gp35 [Cellulophaga phage phi46:1]
MIVEQIIVLTALLFVVLVFAYAKAMNETITNHKIKENGKSKN